MPTVTELANLLGVNEFEIFVRAYEHWYGRAPEPVRLEWEFGRYITGQGQLPVYVKSFLGKQHVLIA